MGEQTKDKQRIVKIDQEQRLLYGIVMVPDEVDSQGDWAKAEDIEKAAHSFAENYRDIGVGHEQYLTTVKVVENYIAPSDVTINGQLVTKGSWVMVTKIYDDEIWQEVKKGELTGYSVQGQALSGEDDGKTTH